MFRPTDDYGHHEIPQWPDAFPDVLTHTTVPGLRAAGGGRLDDRGQSRLYLAAKAGDASAADRVVRELVQPTSLEPLAVLGNATFVPVAALESPERRFNALPSAYAREVSRQLGNPVSPDIVQSNVVLHTGKRLKQRLKLTPTFSGRVVEGQEYVLVDDVLGSGSTLAALRNYICSHGGVVVHATTLAHIEPRPGAVAFNPRRLAIAPATAGAIRDKFDILQLDRILRTHGTAPTHKHLADGQGRAALRYASVDTLGAALAAGAAP